jgi:hypothetical protein
MSDTPRTDSATFYADTSVTVTELCVTEEFARILERENAALRELLERSKPAVRWCMGNEYDPTAKGASAILLHDIDAAMKEEGK